MNTASTQGNGQPGNLTTSLGAAAPRVREMKLCGWGRYPVVDSQVYRPEKIAELAALVAANSTSLTPRGAGRAYGDAAVNGGNRVVDLQRLNRILAFDPQSGILRCETGVT